MYVHVCPRLVSVRLRARLYVAARLHSFWSSYGAHALTMSTVEAAGGMPPTFTEHATFIEVKCAARSKPSAQAAMIRISTMHPTRPSTHGHLARGLEGLGQGHGDPRNSDVHDRIRSMRCSVVGGMEV